MCIDIDGVIAMEGSEGGLAEQLTRSVAWPDFGPTGEMGREWRVVAGLAQARIVKLVAEALVGHSLFNLDSRGRIEFLFGPEPVISEDFQQMVLLNLSMDSPEQVRKWVQRLRRAADKLEEDLGDVEVGGTR